MDEFDFIERHLRPLAEGFPPALGLQDDAALLDPGGAVATTVDGLVEGIHFPAGFPPEDVASRALRASLSDLAAMGAEPWCYLLFLALPEGAGEAWLASFAGRLGEEQGAFGIQLAGGDTVSTPGPLTVAVTALGRTGGGQALRRDGAREGDAVLVSGTIGDAHLGLRALAGGLRLPEADAGRLRARFLAPEPRIGLGTALRGLASAAIDVSDGLVADLRRMCAASGTGAVVERDAVPLSEPARRAVEDGLADWRDLAAGGDDYELVVAVPGEGVGKALDAARAASTPLAPVGSMTADGGVTVRGPDGGTVDLESEGYRHA